MKIVILTFSYCFLFACNAAKVDKNFGENDHNSMSEKYPEVFFSPSRAYTVVSFEGAKGIEEHEWEQWRKYDYVKLHRSKVRLIVIDGTILTEASMKFFLTFDKAETVLIGYSEYGVRLTQKTFEQIQNFKKITRLVLSVHSLTDDYFHSIKTLKTLDYLEVHFPSTPVPYKKRNGEIGAAKLSNNALEEISKSQNLKEISFNYGGDDVKFSSVGIKQILKIQKLEYFSVSIDNILQEDLKRIKKLNLKGVVSRVEHGSLVWGTRKIDRSK